LRREAEGPHECTTHAFAIRKTRFFCDDVTRVPPLLHHDPGSLQPKLFNSFGGCLTGFGQKGAAELTGAKPGDGCEFLNREGALQVLADVGQNQVDALRFWNQVK
jgi:hypothetical protein